MIVFVVKLKGVYLISENGIIKFQIWEYFNRERFIFNTCIHQIVLLQSDLYFLFQVS